MLKLMQRRDFIERELYTREMGIANMDIMKQSNQQDFDRQLANYQKWKKTNNMEGIKY